MNNKNLIAISGKSKSGKDTVGKIIQYLTSFKPYNLTIEEFITGDCWLVNSQNARYEIKKFADKLKDIVCLLTSCTKKDLESQEFKDRLVGEEWDCFETTSSWNSNIELSNLDSIPSTHTSIRKLTYRNLLELIREGNRNIVHLNIWINSLFSEYKEKFISGGIGNFHDPRPSYKSIGLPNWIITDLRYKNEAKFIKNKSGILIRVNRGIDKKNTHISERDLDDYKEWDYIIDNNGTIEELIDKVKEILIKEEII